MRMTVTLSTAAVMWMFYLTLCLLIPQMDTSNAAAVLTSQGAHSGQDSIILSLTNSLIDLVLHPVVLECYGLMKCYWNDIQNCYFVDAIVPGTIIMYCNYVLTTVCPSVYY